ncbi:MAG: DUF4834 family protein [Flavobacteriales bacterium]|nr:DUF4834 family protein [Flavobacteriales bacterium]
MLVNVLRFLMIIWIVSILVRWFNRWRAADKRKAYEAGKREAKIQRPNREKKDMNTDSIGDYVDYEEVK